MKLYFERHYDLKSSNSDAKKAQPFSCAHVPVFVNSHGSVSHTFFIACRLLSSTFSYPLCPSGIRFGAQPGAGVPEDGMHVQSSDLLQGDSSAEGSGGRAGQEVQEGSHTGNWGWSQ